MQLLFRQVHADEVERDPTQRDQFDNEDVELVDALVREAIQNSLDARIDSAASSQIRVRFNITDFAGDRLVRLLDILRAEELDPHLAAVSLPALSTINAMSLLSVEDFGTTGLIGKWNERDQKPFSDFWRRVGRSHKGGAKLGRWGLGKLVFSSASTARVFLGVTVRNDDDARLLMGQVVLKHHQLEGGALFDSHAFYGYPAENGLQLPEIDEKEISAFSELVGLRRTTESGLSIVVPALRDSITLERIVQGVVRNYFFPILFGALIVEVGDSVIDAASFPSIVSKFDKAHFAGGGLSSFIIAMKELRENRSETFSSLPPNWSVRSMDDALGSSLQSLRDTLNEGEVVAIRAPILLKQKDGTERQTYVDAFLQRSAETSHALFVRNAIVLNGESRYFRGKNVFAALVADEPAISAFLGDTENPAHTAWSAQAEKANAAWRSARERLADIRHLLTALHNSLVSAVETVDHNALAGVFSIPSEPGTLGKARKGSDEEDPSVPPIPSRARAYRVLNRRGGFAVHAAVIDPDDLPVSIRVRAAYDVMRGNAFSKFDKADFDFSIKRIMVSAEGATVAVESPNVLLIVAERSDFKVEVSGFDVNRDLIINPVRIV